MTSLPEQFSAAAGQSQAQVRAQFEAQCDFFHKVSNQALEGASRFAALNLAVSRDSVERSTRAVQSLIGSRDPRDLLVFGGHAKDQVYSLFDYSRELLGIASSLNPYAALQAPVNLAATAPQLAARAIDAVDAVVTEPAPPTVNVAQAEVVVVAEPQAEPEPAPEAASESASVTPIHAESAEPVVVVEAAPVAEAAPADLLAAEPAPVAEPTQIAVAAGNGEAHAGVAPHPAAAPVKLESAPIQVPKVAASRRKNK